MVINMERNPIMRMARNGGIRLQRVGKMVRKSITRYGLISREIDYKDGNKHGKDLTYYKGKLLSRGKLQR